MDSPAAAKAVVTGRSRRESELEQELQRAYAQVACVMQCVVYVAVMSNVS